jgi:hypothetical protein
LNHDARKVAPGHPNDRVVARAREQFHRDRLNVPHCHSGRKVMCGLTSAPLKLPVTRPDLSFATEAMNRDPRPVALSARPFVILCHR